MQGDRHHHRCRPGRPGGAERSSPARRLEAVARLAEAGLFAGVLLMPVLPFLEDNVENLRAVVEAAAEAGAGLSTPRSV